MHGGSTVKHVPRHTRGVTRSLPEAFAGQMPDYDAAPGPFPPAVGPVRLSLPERLAETPRALSPLATESLRKKMGAQFRVDTARRLV
jgi:hypothetical protein